MSFRTVVRIVRASFRSLTHRSSSSRRLLRRFVVGSMITSTIFAGMPLRGAVVIWDAGSGVDSNWSTAANWSGDLPPSASDDVLFPGAIPGGSPLFGQPTVITLASGELANSLTLNNRYTLSGGDLTLTSGNVRVSNGYLATIDSQLNGTSGLTLSGSSFTRGALRLTNAGNTYAGTTTIAGGTFVVTSSGALGTDSSAVVVGAASTTFSGAASGGGTLLIDGGATGISFARALTISGTGNAVGGFALVNVGNNTLTGRVTTSGTTQINSTFGTLTLADLANSGTTRFGETRSLGNTAITGRLAGIGIVESSGLGTIILNPSDATGYSGVIRASGGTIRISSPAALGTNAGTGTSATIDVNGGVFEFRLTDSNINKNVVARAGGSLYFDRAIGGGEINTTVNFGATSVLTVLAGTTATFAGRNGLGVTFGGNVVVSADGGMAIANNLSGLLKFSGTTFFNSTSLTAQNLTFNGSGETLVSGNIAGTGGAHTLTKAGTGTLTLDGTSNLTGATSVQSGTLAINDFRAINNTSTVPINLGNAAATGTLTIGTAAGTPSAADLITARPLVLNGAAGDAAINANQSIAEPVIFTSSAAIAATVGNKSLTLGGTNTQNNEIRGILQDSTGRTTSLIKTGLGTWLLSGANTYTGNTTISGGTLKLQANAPSSSILADVAAIVFNVNAITQTAGGTLELLGVAGQTTTESLGALTPTAGAGTIKLTAGIGGSANLVFASLPAIVANGTGINFDTTAAGGGTVTLTGIATTTATTLPGAGHVYLNGADFARSVGGVLVAPAYGTDAGFAIATQASFLVAASHNLVASDIILQPNQTVSSLKIVNSSLTLLSSNMLQIRLGANSSGGLLATGGVSSINGGFVTVNNARDLVVRVNDSTDRLTIASVISSSTTGGLTKNGLGTLILTGANLQTGPVSINEGTLTLGTGGTLGGSTSGANGTILNIRQGATLDLNGVGSFGVVGLLNGSGTVTNGGTADAVLSVGLTSTNSGTFAGVIQDGVGITSFAKVGAGDQVLSGLSTYTGPTILSDSLTGSLTVTQLADIGNPSSIGKGKADANAASLVFSGTFARFVYAGTTSVSTNRLFTLSGAADGTGVRLLNNSPNNSSLIFSNPDPIAFDADALHTLTLGGTSLGDSRIDLRITDGSLPTRVVKVDSNLWILGNAQNSYQGETLIGGGALQATDNASLPRASTLTFSGGVLQTAGTFSRTLGDGENQFSWFGSGGFAASTDKLTVDWGSTPTWGETFRFLAGTNSFILNSPTALFETEIRSGFIIPNGTVATIQTDDNTSTNTDFATISGVIGGEGSVSKTGTGTLQLLGANTYAGTTTVTAGTLVVNSLGHSGLGGASSVGTATGADQLTHAILLGNGGTGPGILQYVGPGETSDRVIVINTTTGNTQIVADGSGPLVLTNVVNSSLASARNLYLRGSNTFGNQITSNLADSSGVLTIQKDTVGTWILSGTNTFTGPVNVSAGAIGAGSDGAFGVAGLRFLNAASYSFFAYGADRSITSPAIQLQNSTLTYVGDHNLTLNNQFSISAGNANQIRWTNNIAPGKSLTIAGNLVRTDVVLNVVTSLVIDGTGDATISGNITNANPSPTSPWGLTYSGTGSLTLSGAANTYNGTTAITSGTLKLGANEVIPNGAAAASVVLGGAAGTSTVFDLNGKNETINGLTYNTAGNVTIDNTSALQATLTFGDTGAAITFTPAVGGVGRISNSGGGALSIVKSGTSLSTISGSTLTYTGTTSVTGGSLTIASPLAGTTGLSVTGGSSLVLSGGLAAPDAIHSVIVDGGSTLNLWDGGGTPISLLTILNLGAGTGITTLNLELGSGADSLLSNNAAVIANSIKFNLKGVAGIEPGFTYILLSAPSGLSAGSYSLGSTPTGYLPGTLQVFDSQVTYTAGAAISGTFFWNNTQGNGSWIHNNAGNTNWRSDVAGTTEAGFTPGGASTVVFNTSTVGSGTVTTTLDSDFYVNDLKFAPNAPGVTAVVINPGTPATSSLTIAPAVATDGIDVAANAANVTIAARVNLGAAQTWKINGTGNSSLAVSGIVAGSAALVKAGAGLLSLSGANVFNGGLTIAAGSTLGTVSPQAFGTGTITLGATTGTNAATLLVGTTGLTFTNPIVLATNATAGALTIGNSGTTISTTFSGGVTGTNNLVINSSSGTGTISFTTNPINISGTITHAAGTGTGTTTISGGIGSNVREIIQNSVNAALAITKVAGSTFVVNSAGTTLTRAATTNIKAITVSSGVTGTGDLIVNNLGVGNSGVVFSVNPVNIVGKIIIQGSGTGASSVVFSGGIGSNVSEVRQTGTPGGSISGPVTVSPTDITLAVATGATGSLVLSGGTTGTGDLYLSNGHSAGNLSVTTTAPNHIGRIIANGGGSGNTGITASIGPNITDVIQRSLTSQLVINTTAITVNPSVGGTTLQSTGGATARLLVNAGTSGTGDLFLKNDGATSGGITLASNPVNHTGRLINAGVGNSAIVSAVIGPAVTQVVQNGSSPLVLSGVNTYTGPTRVLGGTLQLTATGSINNSPLISIDGGGTFNVAAVVGYAPAVGQTLAAYDDGIATVTGGVNAVDRTIDLQSGTLLGRLNFSAGLTLGNSLLKFDLGEFDSDTISIGGLATLTGSILNVIDLSAIAGATQLTVGTRAYTLVTSAGGWNNDYFRLASPTVIVNGLIYGVALSADSRNQYLDVTAPVAPTSLYWRGGVGGSGTVAGRNWTSVAETFENNFNLADGTSPAYQDPTTTTNVFFAAAAAAPADLSTSLGRSYSINSLNFITADPVSILGGPGITLTLNGTTAGGNSSQRAIYLAATSGPVMIATDILLGGDQFWRNDSANPLTIAAGAEITGLQKQLTIQADGPVVIAGSLSISGGGDPSYVFRKPVRDLSPSAARATTPCRRSSRPACWKSRAWAHSAAEAATSRSPTGPCCE